jgi:hypothetical protein
MFARYNLKNGTLVVSNIGRLHDYPCFRCSSYLRPLFARSKDFERCRLGASWWAPVKLQGLTTIYQLRLVSLVYDEAPGHHAYAPGPTLHSGNEIPAGER